jgi:ABC-2 type transport system permease protein
MFPMTSAPTWLKTLMALDPLTYGVDAFRNVVFSNTQVADGSLTQPLIDVARAGGLVRFQLGFDVALMVLVAIVFAWAGAWQFSKAQAA